MRIIAVIMTTLMMLAIAPANAALRPGVLVEGVQMPAWVEHAGGARNPLAVGTALSDKDRTITGPGARALLRRADGSAIKLGENGVLGLDDVGQKKTQMKDVVTATLDVVSGAFRFTTLALNRFRG
jgi:hypothetical protein